VVGNSPTHQFVFDGFGRAGRQKARETLASQVGDRRLIVCACRPLKTLADPSEHIFAEEKQHAPFAVAAVEQAAFQIVGVGAVVGDRPDK